jgi:PAS domain-containing protein
MPERETGVNLNEIEIILVRQLAGTLTTPLMIFDPHGTLLYYNESAEPILGLRFEETGRIQVNELVAILHPTDERDQPLPLSSLPSPTALAECRPASNRFWMRGFDGVRHHVEVTAFPLIGRGERFLGTLSLFWETDEDPAAAIRSELTLSKAVRMPPREP